MKQAFEIFIMPRIQTKKRSISCYPSHQHYYPFYYISVLFFICINKCMYIKMFVFNRTRMTWYYNSRNHIPKFFMFLRHVLYTHWGALNFFGLDVQKISKKKNILEKLEENYEKYFNWKKRKKLISLKSIYSIIELN